MLVVLEVHDPQKVGSGEYSGNDSEILQVQIDVEVGMSVVWVIE
jgi:hypothetical protein